MELHFARFRERFDIKESLIHSISILKTAIEQVDRKIKMTKEYERYYTTHLERVCDSFERSPCGLGVVGTAAYVMKMGNIKIAVDPSLFGLPVGNEDKQTLFQFLSDFDAIIITHEHLDHFDKDILKKLPENVKFFLPDFMADENMRAIWTSAGYVTMLQDVKLTFFESNHSGEGTYIPEYGFAVTYKEGNYVFSADVRNYKIGSHPIFPNTKALIVHLWLGRENALNLYNNAYIEDFCSFANSYHAEKVFVSHMFDVRRQINDMWTDIHYDAVKYGLGEGGYIRLGDWIEF